MTFRNIYTVALAITASCSPAIALTVNSQPGQLQELVGQETNATNLVVEGSINALDFDFIAQKMTALTSLDLGKATIEEYTGNRVLGLTMHKAGMIPAHTFSGSALTAIVLPQSGEISIGDGAFAGSAITTLTLPSNVVSIGSGAFTSCLSLKTVNISASVTGEGTFSACPALETVTVSSSALQVGDYAFSSCTSLASVNGAGKITSVGNNSFAQCAALRTFDFGSRLESIGNESFRNSGLEKVDLTECSSLKTVGHWSFAQMPQLTEASLGGVSEIGDGVFFGCPALATVEYSSEATAIPDYTYVKDTALSSETILHENITTIGDYALSGVTGISKIALPDALESLGDHAMERMTGLTDINISRDVAPETGENVWEGVDQSTVNLNVPEENVGAYESADQWRLFNICVLSGIHDIDGADETALSGLSGRFEGYTLVVRIADVEIETLRLYDTAGLLLTAVNPQDSIVRIDTTSFSGNIFIVTAALADGRVATLKLARL